MDVVAAQLAGVEKEIRVSMLKILRPRYYAALTGGIAALQIWAAAFRRKRKVAYICSLYMCTVTLVTKLHGEFFGTV